MNQEDYYFVSVGEKSYFYTLNYSYIHIKYIKSGIEQRPFPIAERRYTFLRNLSHDFDEAMEKAKAWYASDSYQAIISYRHAGALANGWLVEGLA